MTCIVGLVEDGVVYMGADSVGATPYVKTKRKDKKVFKLKDTDKAVAGFTTSFRMGQLLMYEEGLLDMRDEEKIGHEYLVKNFVPNIIKLFEKNGFGKVESGEKTGGTFLFGFKDKLYKIDSDYQVEESGYDFSACGCGEEVALGSLFSTEGKGIDPVERVRLALEAASCFSISVSGPFHILNTKTNDVVSFPE